MPGRERDLFNPVVPPERLNPLFQGALDPGHTAARKLMNAVFADFQDVDSSFVREFQTGGFSSRIFELALFTYLEEQNLDLDRSHPAPDFVVCGDRPVAIEVTTTNPAQDAPMDLGPPFELLPKDLDDADREFVFQVGKALRRKLLYRDAQGHAYWEKLHVAGIPFVIAVGAFHGPHAQIHPVGLLGEYLYGTRNVGHYDEAGRSGLSRGGTQGLLAHPELPP